jgi:hypothetical protein
MDRRFVKNVFGGPRRKRITDTRFQKQDSTAGVSKIPAAGTEERFSDCIVPTIPMSAHALYGRRAGRQFV